MALLTTTRTSRAIGRATLVLALMSLPAQVWALAEPEDDEDADEPAQEFGEAEMAAARPADQGAEDNATEDADAAVEKSASPASERAWSFGPYVRFVVVPSFMLELFLDLAPTSSHAAFGVTARYRIKPGGAIIDMGLGYASYAFEGPFRSKGGEENDTEWVESDLALIHLTGSILWDTEISKQFAFEYGVGLDFGIVTGEFKRTEAYTAANGQYGKCGGIGQPPNNYCLAPLTGARSDPYTVKGEQYEVVDERVPGVIALPMLPRLGLRYSPMPELAVRFEASYGIAQVWLGLSAAYVP